MCAPKNHFLLPKPRRPVLRHHRRITHNWQDFAALPKSPCSHSPPIEDLIRHETALEKIIVLLSALSSHIIHNEDNNLPTTIASILNFWTPIRCATANLDTPNRVQDFGFGGMEVGGRGKELVREISRMGERMRVHWARYGEGGFSGWDLGRLVGMSMDLLGFLQGVGENDEEEWA